MAKRMILMLVAVATLLSVLGLVKYRQIQAAIAQQAAFQMPPEAVTTIVAKQEMWRSRLSAIGTVAAVHGVTVSADLPGIVEKIAFRSGQRVHTGDLLVHLDTRQEEAQLAAARAKRDLANLSLERIRGLREKGVSSQAEFDTASAASEQAEASVREIQATIDRKTIRAPFSGILGIRSVNLGQYMTSGQPVVPLQSLDPIYVNFSVPQQELRQVAAGSEVRVSGDGLPQGEDLVGRITALDSVVDPATRNVQVQATFDNPKLRLRPGMFVRAEVVQPAEDPVVPIPASAIRYAPYGDSVFIVEEQHAKDGSAYKGVRQQFVKLGPSRGDLIAVLSGVKPGEEIVTSGAFKLRNGAAVQVNNEIQPGDSPAPKTEDN
ncbi:MAG TPA: efflux RND transporter periplasmic adaptor subunit [Candidatus Polarisedimenticolia bacterium]|nr:efflux RND transporter periplasmic adaptor subunit [Candidatus Polarisedimenticolia bacterium]